MPATLPPAAKDRSGLQNPAAGIPPRRTHRTTRTAGRTGARRVHRRWGKFAARPQRRLGPAHPKGKLSPRCHTTDSELCVWHRTTGTPASRFHCCFPPLRPPKCDRRWTNPSAGRPIAGGKPGSPIRLFPLAKDVYYRGWLVARIWLYPQQCAGPEVLRDRLPYGKPRVAPWGTPRRLNLRGAHCPRPFPAVQRAAE